MLNYLKNFIIKLILLPVLSLLGIVFLIFFLLSPQFKIFKDKKTKPWLFFKSKGNKNGNEKEKVKDYEAFY